MEDPHYEDRIWELSATRANLIAEMQNDGLGLPWRNSVHKARMKLIEKGLLDNPTRVLIEATKEDPIGIPPDLDELDDWWISIEGLGYLYRASRLHGRSFSMAYREIGKKIANDLAMGC